MATTLADLPIPLPMDEIAVLCREYQVRELSIFGSVLRNDFRDESDIDLLVLFEPEAQIGFLELAGLQFALADLLSRSVDLVPKNGLKPFIRDEVLASAQVIYAAVGPPALPSF
ncbi:MAG TPA: nucleotidyltransferase family protein [Thermomicrobiales bacterium]|nr:nucleotidyltransferase family protein [Thermomicrobiales bacterium]